MPTRNGEGTRQNVPAENLAGVGINNDTSPSVESIKTGDDFKPTSEVLDNGDIRASVGENQILVTHVSKDIPVDKIIRSKGAGQKNVPKVGENKDSFLDKVKNIFKK